MRLCPNCEKEMPPRRFDACSLRCAIALQRAATNPNAQVSNSPMTPQFLADVITGPPSSTPPEAMRRRVNPVAWASMSSQFQGRGRKA